MKFKKKKKNLATIVLFFSSSQIDWSHLNQNLRFSAYLSRSSPPSQPRKSSNLLLYFISAGNWRGRKKREGENNKAVPHYRRADANLVAQLPRSWFHRSVEAVVVSTCRGYRGPPPRRENEKKFKGIIGRPGMRGSKRPRRISLSPEIPSFSWPKLPGLSPRFRNYRCPPSPRHPPPFTPPRF